MGNSTPNSETGGGCEGDCLRNMDPPPKEYRGLCASWIPSLQQQPTVQRVTGREATVSGPTLTVRYENLRLSAASPALPHRAAVQHVRPGDGRCTRGGRRCIYQEGCIPTMVLGSSIPTTVLGSSIPTTVLGRLYTHHGTREAVYPPWSLGLYIPTMVLRAVHTHHGA